MKPTEETIRIILNAYSSTNKKLEYLYEQERKLKNSGNALKDELTPKEKTLLDHVQGKIKRYKKELDDEKIKRAGQFEPTPDLRSLSKEHIYNYFDELKANGMSVKEAHEKIQEVLRVNGFEPEEKHVNENPNSFNRKVNQYFSRKRKRSS